MISRRNQTTPRCSPSGVSRQTGGTASFVQVESAKPGADQVRDRVELAARAAHGHAREVADADLVGVGLEEPVLVMRARDDRSPRAATRRCAFSFSLLAA